MRSPLTSAPAVSLDAPSASIRSTAQPPSPATPILSDSLTSTRRPFASRSFLPPQPSRSPKNTTSMLRSTTRLMTRARSTLASQTTAVPASAASSNSQSENKTTSHTTSNTAAPSPKRKLRSPTDPAADYKTLLEARFGGAEAAALGTLVDGQPEGQARNVKKNMFRLM